MKRLICTLAGLATLIWTCPPAQAEFKGTLPRDLDLILNVDNSSSSGQTGVTVIYLGRGRIDDIEMRTVASGGRVQFVFSRPERGVRRIIVEVDPPLNSTVIDVDFAGFPERIEGFERLVFDVVD